MSRRAASEPALRVELTERQREVLRLVADGYTNGEIAERLGISLDGAKWHVREILGKLGVDSREEAAEWWKHHQGARWRRALQGVAWRWALGGAAAVGAAGIVAAVAWAALGGGDSAPAAVPTTVATKPAPSVSPSPSALAAAEPVQVAGFAAKGLAFIRDGDLWVADGVGGKSPVREVQVTRGAKLSRPSWSYSGEWVLAQTADGAAWLFNANGKAVPLTGVSSVAWAPDRDEFAGSVGGAIVIGTPDNPAKLRTISHPRDGERDTIPAWGPDGTQIAFVRLQVSTGQRIADQVWVIRRDGTQETAVFADQKGGYDYLWGWAGNYVAFWYNASRSASIFADGATLLAVPVPDGPLVTLGYTLGYADFVAAQPHGGGVLVVEGSGRHYIRGPSRRAGTAAERAGGGSEFAYVVAGWQAARVCGWAGGPQCVRRGRGEGAADGTAHLGAGPPFRRAAEAGR
jgi:DNA-binding CsgD family transcriptional regulator